MTQKQLANVLTKILGLSFLPESIMRIVSGLLNILDYSLMAASGRGGFGHGLSSPAIWTNFTSGLILGVIGIGLILKSRKIVEWLFRGEVE